MTAVANSAPLPLANRPSFGTNMKRLFTLPVCTLLFLTLVLLIGFSAMWPQRDAVAVPQRGRTEQSLADIPFNGARAYGYLRQICSIGPRVSGSPGMEKQQQALAAHFRKLGGEVEMQRFQIRDRRTGDPVIMANMIVRWHPERKKRILLAAHYDTRPFPDRDPDLSKRKDEFIGANDGASGVALLAEMGRHMPDLDSEYGVDFVLFDGEEYVFDESDEYFLGSGWFARKYAREERDYEYRWGVLVDMIGDKDLQIYQERLSASWRDTRPLVRQIWNQARALGVKEFIARPRHEVRDDHLPLHEIAKIPCIDIIDFDYPRPGENYWHTTQDVPENCSALSLAKVGWVLHEWLKSVK